MREDLHGLAGAFALDALAPDERRRFDGHLDRCPACRQDVHDLQATAALLATAVAERPPAELRSSVLAEARETRQVSPLPSPWHAPRGTSTARRLLAVAAALLLLVGVVSVSRSMAGPGGEVVSSEVAALLAAPDARVVDLRDGDAGLVLRLVWSPATGRAAAVGRGVADPGEGRAYELWAIGEQGAPVSAGLMSPDDDGRIEAVMDADLRGAVTLAVTVEPEAGSPDAEGPSGPMVASGIL